LLSMMFQTERLAFSAEGALPDDDLAHVACGSFCVDLTNIGRVRSTPKSDIWTNA